MKKLVLTTVTLLLVVINLKAQEPTTIEDYNYLTKGLKFQMENGLGIKQGYNIKEVGSFKDTSDKCTVYAFYKTNNTDIIRAILVTIETKEEIIYICIPNSTSDISLKQASYNRINNKLTKSQISLIAFAIAYI